jgi:hypothetical protein
MPVRLLLPILLVLSSIVSSLATESETSTQDQSHRLAIVVGNSNYQSHRLEHLPNAANDARRLSETLERLNFEVVMATDVSREAFDRLLAEAEQKLPTASSVLIFYAGHGVQLDGENYLLPVDTPDPDTADKLTERAIKLNDVIGRFASRTRQTFVFLDACRNNPMPAGQGVGNGLAQVEVGENTFIAFATQPGNVTVDGAGENSPFTTALLKNLEIPGLSISDMMIRVRNETEALTVGRQVPWDQSNLREQFYFTEQQMLDPTQLSASLSRILSDPIAKEKLQVELASSDLQTAVLIVGQTLRSVSGPLDGAAASPVIEGAPTSAGVQVASANPAQALEGARKSVAENLGTLIVGSITPDSQVDEKQERDLARSVQTELRRLGCYRMTVDGDWGKGSVRALNEYYRNTKQAAAATDPTVELLGDLFLRSGRICKEPVIVKRVAQNVQTLSGSRQDPGTKGKGKRKQSSQQPSRAPAPPPPDISSGIGIGGIF